MDKACLTDHLVEMVGKAYQYLLYLNKVPYGRGPSVLNCTALMTALSKQEMLLVGFFKLSSGLMLKNVRDTAPHYLNLA